MFAVRSAFRLGARITEISRRGCAAGLPVDDVVNGLTEEQIQVTLDNYFS